MFEQFISLLKTPSLERYKIFKHSLSAMDSINYRGSEFSFSVFEPGAFFAGSY